MVSAARPGSRTGVRPTLQPSAISNAAIDIGRSLIRALVPDTCKQDGEQYDRWQDEGVCVIGDADPSPARSRQARACWWSRVWVASTAIWVRLVIPSFARTWDT